MKVVAATCVSLKNEPSGRDRAKPLGSWKFPRGVGHMLDQEAQHRRDLWALYVSRIQDWRPQHVSKVRRPGRIVGFDHKVLWNLHQGLQWKWQLEEHEMRTSQRFWLTWCWAIESPGVQSTATRFRGDFRSTAGAQLCGSRRSRPRVGAATRATPDLLKPRR